MPTTTAMPLLEPGDLRLLEGVRFAPRRRFAGRTRGERLSKQKGISVEFADYRDYTPGDDLRHLDWSILARLERATIRTYQDEDDLAVYLLVDTSPSMDFGEPVKFRHALSCAAALGFVGLLGQDAVRPIALGSRERPARTLRGRGSYNPLVNWLGEQRPEGKIGLASSLTRFASSGAYRPGLAVCLTDGLDPDAPDALRAIGARGHEIALIQILSPVELEPDLEGDLRLLDAETGEAVEVTAHAETLREYQKNLAAHCALLEATAVRHGGRYVRTIAGEPIAEFITRGLQRTGIVR